ncbi:MAG: hypothetical protein ACK53Y_15595, partial [bacterium]
YWEWFEAVEPRWLYCQHICGPLKTVIVVFLNLICFQYWLHQQVIIKKIRWAFQSPIVANYGHH